MGDEALVGKKLYVKFEDDDWQAMDQAAPADPADGAVDHPSHYAGDGKVECMDAIHSMLTGYGIRATHAQAYWAATALKYVWRWPNKNRVEDIDKAIRCLEYLKEEVGE